MSDTLQQSSHPSSTEPASQALVAAPLTTIFYVSDVAKSCRFYARILGVNPVDQSANFAAFALGNGTMLGLWNRRDVQPPILASGTGGELCFAFSNKQSLEDTSRAWHRDGTVITQTPTTMDFGYTFTAEDPDGHRIRCMVLPQ